MINDNTILSSFDDKPTLLEWLKKVEDALKTDTAKTISVENPEPNTYVFKITFADGNSISSGNVVFPNAVQDVSIKNGHIIVTQISGTQTDLGAINPYAETIVENAETNTTKIVNNAEVGGNLEVKGLTALGGNTGVNGTLSTTGKITSNGGVEVHGDAIFFDGLGTPATLSGAHVVAGTTELLPVTPNPTGEATQTLEKIKIGDVAYKVGGASENEREFKLILPYSSSADIIKKPVTIEDENIWAKLNNYYYETIKIYYNDDKPLGVFNVIDYIDNQGNKRKNYFAIVPQVQSGSYHSQWYGSLGSYEYRLLISLQTSSGIHTLQIYNSSDSIKDYSLDKSKFDALYKLADKPTQDGTYILKASVSGGVVTYTWELQQ